MTEDTVLKPGQQIKAMVNLDDARRLVELYYGLPVKSITELTAYDDRNFHVLCEDKPVTNNPYVSSLSEDGYVLKIINSLDSKKTGFYQAQNELLLFLDKKGIICTIPVKQKDGSYHSLETFHNGGKQSQYYVKRFYMRNLMKFVGIFSICGV